MAEWKHKDRHWINESRYQESIFTEKLERESNYMSRDSVGHFSFIVRDFSTWLDYQCEEGWEVFKISRDFNGRDGTWCIFRRLV